MTQSGYQVHLPAFAGPLDLLLQLIEQQQLDITLISLAQVTDQYLAYIAGLTQAPPDDLAAFLSVAARLLLIKSRALLPRPPTSIEEEQDVGDDLVRQLCEYKKFKQVAQILADRASQGLRAYARDVPPAAWAGIEPKIDLSSLSPDDLRFALRALLEEQLGPSDDWSVVPYAITIDERISEIKAQLSRRHELRFSELCTRTPTRMGIIVTLLALLEMIRHQVIQVHQEELFGEIVIQRATSATEPG